MISIESFDNYKDSYKYHIFNTVEISKRVKRLTLDDAVSKKADRLKRTVLDANRGVSKLDEIHFGYVLMLMNYVSLDELHMERVVFDHLYDTIINNKSFQKAMNSLLLKNIVDEVR